MTLFSSINITDGISLVLSLITIVLGAVVILDNPKGRVNRIFLFLILSGLFWTISVLLRFHQDSEHFALIYARLTFGFAALVIYSYYLLASNFPREVVFKRIDAFINPISLIIIALSFSPLTVANISISATGQIDTYSWGYLFFVTYFPTILITGSLKILTSYRKLTENEQTQAKLMGIGFIIAAVFGFATNVLIPFFSGITEIATAGPLSLAPFVLLTGYAILKHHLFRVKVIATETITFSLWIVIFIRMLLSVDSTQKTIDVILFTIVVLVGILLIKSVFREVEQREHIEQLAKELEHANIQLTGFDQQKSEFVSIASHQLRSPLTAIKGYSSMILEGSYGKVPDKLREPIDRIFMSSDTLVLVIENFLNISRIEQGRMRYDFEPTDPVLLAKHAVDQLSPNATKKGLDLKFEVTSDNGFAINADPEKLRQCFLNFIDNAIKYTPKGSITVSIGKKGNAVIYSVKDTGVGMRPETVARLFQKFSRANDANKTNAGGAGLGLFLASEIVKAHNGRVWAESAGPYLGSTFSIEIPLVQNISK